MQAVLDEARFGLIDNWLRHVADVKEKHQNVLTDLTPKAQSDALCELNVIEQVRNVCLTNLVQDAWQRGQDLTIHGLVYGLKDGLLKEIYTAVSDPETLQSGYQDAIFAVADRQLQ